MPISRILAVLLFCGIVLTQVSAENRFFFPSGMEGYPGEDVTIYFMLETDTVLSGYGFSCAIDTTAFEFTLPDSEAFTWDTTAADAGNLTVRFVSYDDSLGSFGGFALNMMGCYPGVSIGEWVVININIHIKNDASPGVYAFQVPYPGNPCGGTDCDGFDVNFNEYDGLFEVLAHLTMTAPDADTVDEEMSSSFEVVAVDEFGHNVDLTLNYTDLPPGSYVWNDVGGSDSVSGTFQTNPGWCDSGEYIAVFHAQCTEGITAEHTVAIKINDVNRAPYDIITNPECPVLFQVGNLGQITITGRDYDWDECSDDSLEITFFDISPDSFLDHGDGTADIFWTPDTADTGSFVATFTVTDSYSEFYSEECSIQVVIHDVQITVVDADTVNEGEISSFDVYALCTQGHNLTIVLTYTDLPPGSYTWTDTSGSGSVTETFQLHPEYCDSGNYSVAFHAECAEGESDDATVAITIINVNQEPTVDGGPDRAVMPSHLLTFDVYAQDPDSVCGDTVTWSYSGYPFGHGATLSPGRWVRTFSWTPTEADTGIHDAIFAVDDGFVTHTDTVTITVSPHTLTLSTIPDPPPTVVDEGNTLTFDVVAVDADPEHMITLSATYLPPYASFPTDSGAGSVQITFNFGPDYCQAGVDSAVFEAHCSGGLTTDLTVQFTINDTPREPGIEADGPYSAKPEELLTFTVEASDLDLQCGDESLTITALDVPAGATFDQVDDTTGVFNWTPVEADTGEYTITFIVEDHTALSDTDEAVINVVVFDFEDVTNIAQVGNTGPGYGVAWGDYDSDGDLDIYVVNYNQANLLYRNNGDGSFTEVASIAGVGHTGPGHGAAWGDYDNDGDLDLYVTNEGPNVFYQNEGNGIFSDVTDLAGVGNTDGGRGVAWADYDLDGDLDFYVANSFLTQASILYSNNGDGTFTNVTTAAGVEFMGNGRGVAWGDYNNDGYPDLYVASYWPGGSALYHNNGDETFTNVATSAGVDNNGLATGIAWADYDLDGNLDLYVVNYNGYGNFLYHNEGTGTFSDATGTAGVGCVTDGYGTAWADYDSDGDLDIYVVNYNQANILYSNDGDGTFSDVTDRAGIGDTGYGYGTGWGDYDGDGDSDLYVVNHDQSNLLYQNQTGGSDYLKVKLVGAAHLVPGLSNRNGIGAWIKVYKTGDPDTLRGLREIRAGSGYCSMNSIEAEFGLDHDYTYDLEVTFPASGIVRLHSDIATTQTVTVYEEQAPLPFSLISPGDGDTSWVLTPLLVWHPSVDPDPGDAVAYTVYYSTDSTFATQDSVLGLIDTTCTLPELSDDTDYYWKVRGIDDFGLEAWSAQTFSFHIYLPESPLAFSLIYPEDQDTVFADTVTLDWEDADDPDPGDMVMYTLYYGTSSVFHPDSTTIVDGLNQSEYYVGLKQFIAMGQAKQSLRSKDYRASSKEDSRLLDDDVVIYWKVRAFDTFSLETWSTETDWAFNVYIPEPPIVFNLISPADEETSWVLTPTVIWETASDPDPGDVVTYTVYYSIDSIFTTQDSISGLLDTTCVLPVLLDDTSYYWRVKGSDSFGLEAWSAQTFSFHIYLPESPLAFSLIYPEDQDTVFADTVTLDWEDADDPDPGDSVLYDLWLSLSFDFSDPVVIDSLTDSEYAFYQGTKSIEDNDPNRFSPHANTEVRYTRRTEAMLLHGKSTERETASRLQRADSLLADTTYYWKVRAYDIWGLEMWSNEIWQFHIASLSAFIRADANSDMIVQMSDVIFTLQYLYVPGSPEPTCMDAVDADDDGDMVMGDAIYTMRYLYVPGSPPIPTPYPECGIDPTDDELDCGWHPCQGVIGVRKPASEKQSIDRNPQRSND